MGFINIDQYAGGVLVLVQLPQHLRHILGAPVPGDPVEGVARGGDHAVLLQQLPHLVAERVLGDRAVRLGVGGAAVGARVALVVGAALSAGAVLFAFAILEFKTLLNGGKTEASKLCKKQMLSFNLTILVKVKYFNSQQFVVVVLSRAFV